QSQRLQGCGRCHGGHDLQRCAVVGRWPQAGRRGGWRLLRLLIRTAGRCTRGALLAAPALWQPDQSMTSAAILNAMTVDVEDYFHVSALASAIPRSEWPNMEFRADASTHRLL